MPIVYIWLAIWAAESQPPPHIRAGNKWIEIPPTAQKSVLKDLQAEYKVAFTLIAQDLATVRYMCTWVAVMYLGQIVELAPVQELFTNPSHPYTKALMSAALPSHPDMEQEEIILQGEVPSPLNPPAGCYFHPRCPAAMDHRAVDKPVVKDIEPGHTLSCHLF